MVWQFWVEMRSEGLRSRQRCQAKQETPIWFEEMVRCDTWKSKAASNLNLHTIFVDGTSTLQIFILQAACSVFLFYVVLKGLPDVEVSASNGWQRHWKA